MADLLPITEADKIAALEREIRMRRLVYKGRVDRNLMPQWKADREIAVMESILKDYQGKT